jgi:poly(3-hydroxyalkanoate) synthetase
MHYDEDMDNEQQHAADDQMRMLEDDCNHVIIDVENLTAGLQEAIHRLERWNVEEARYVLRLQSAYLQKIIKDTESIIGGYQ